MGAGRFVSTKNGLLSGIRWIYQRVRNIQTLGTIGGMNINYLPILVIQYDMVNLKYLAKKNKFKRVSRVYPCEQKTTKY